MFQSRSLFRLCRMLGATDNSMNLLLRSSTLTTGLRGTCLGADHGHSPLWMEREGQAIWKGARTVWCTSSASVKSEDDGGWKAMQESLTLILAEVDDASGVATITINRPEVLNALNTKVRCSFVCVEEVNRSE